MAQASNWTATWTRVKKIPNLATVLRRIDPPRPMKLTAIRATVMNIAKAMGAEVVYRKKGS